MEIVCATIVYECSGEETKSHQSINNQWGRCKSNKTTDNQNKKSRQKNPPKREMPFIRTSTPSIQYHYVHIFRLLFAVFYFSSTYLKAYLTDDRYQLNEICNYYLSTFLLNSTHSLYYYNHKPKFLLSKKVKTQNTSHVTTYVHLLAASTTTTETTKCFNTHTHNWS